MSNHMNPGVKITLGGKQRTIRFDINALCEFERVSGKNVFDILAIHTHGIDDIRCLLYAGLRHEQPDVTVEQAGELIAEAFAEDRFDELGKLLVKAIDEGMPNRKDPGGDARPPASKPASPN